MEVVINQLTRRFGGFMAVDGINLRIPSASCLALLGPSGCGKTTTLNMIAGFLQPDSGEILVGNKSVVGIPPHKRSTGMVFQNYALFPHMTVFDNVAYGLRQRRTPAERIKSEVQRVLGMVRLGELGERYPRQLSGGQQQRVALARALVFGPEILLLDEPLSNLDAKLRETMRVELKEIQRSSGVTTVFVTHDQSEAMALADEVAVMNKGRIEQIGVPQDIYHRPATRFVADFVGSANFFSGSYRDSEGDYALIDVDGIDRVVKVAAPNLARTKGSRVEFMIRPERLRVANQPGGGQNEIECTVQTVVFTGAHVDCFCRVGYQKFHVEYTSGQNSLQPGETAWVSWDSDDAFALRGEGS